MLVPGVAPVDGAEGVTPAGGARGKPARAAQYHQLQPEDCKISSRGFLQPIVIQIDIFY